MKKQDDVNKKNPLGLKKVTLKDLDDSVLESLAGGVTTGQTFCKVCKPTWFMC